MSFKPKLIVVDIDGTILNSKCELSERTKNALQKAIEQNINIIVATGRMYTSALPVLKKAGIHLPSIFFDGALIRNPKTDETLYEKGLGEKLTAEIMDFYYANGWYLQSYFNDNLYVVDNNDPRCKYYESIAKIDAIPLGDDFWSFYVNSSKLLGIEQDFLMLEEKLELTREQFGERIYSVKSWGTFIEMVHPEVNKAAALAILAKEMGIHRKDVLAIGDSENDLEMLEWAGHGVAMGNSENHVKSMADEITLDNDKDGAARIIEKYLRI